MDSVSVDRFFRILKKYELNYSDALDLISYARGVDYKDALNNMSAPISCKDADCIIDLIEAHVPIAYITKRKEFYGREFIVDENTLIPRPETEILVNSVLKKIPLDKQVSVLDLCTGSGCILLTILKERPLVRGVGVDISENALAVAMNNAVKLNVKNAEFIAKDILKDDISFLVKNADIITANPPYLSGKEYAAADMSLRYEPKNALIADDNGYLFYKKILCDIAKSDKIKGFEKKILFFEVGYTQADTVKEMSEKLGDFYIEKDLCGRPRVVYGWLK